MEHLLKLRWHGLLLALLLLAGCGTQALRAPAEAPSYSLANPDEHFARDGRLQLIRREAVIREPHIYLLEPYDPARRVVVMLHGLGSSPDVWQPLDAAPESDAELRRHYQIWHVFYPTNVPIPENLRTIRQALLDTFAAPDISGAAPGITLVGHSMGGVIARLLVVDSGDALWDEFFGRSLAVEERSRFAVLAPYLDLEPLPRVEEAIFLAAPHRGAPMAHDWRGRTASF